MWKFSPALMMGRNPIVIRQMLRRRADVELGGGGGEDGFECCGFCRVCTCLRWGFLATPTGVIKGIELVGGNGNFFKYEAQPFRIPPLVQI